MLGLKLLITVIYRRLSWRIGEIESSGDTLLFGAPFPNQEVGGAI